MSIAPRQLRCASTSSTQCINCSGPETWWIYYPSAAGGNQSPVDIPTEDVHVDLELSNDPLEICYNSPEATTPTTENNDEDAIASAPSVRTSQILVNNGNTARLNIVDSRSCIIIIVITI